VTISEISAKAIQTLSKPHRMWDYNWGGVENS